MKFGETLYRRSVPEWSIRKVPRSGHELLLLTGHATPDNVDYDDLKYFVKLHTTRDPSRPQPIPSGTNQTREAQEFEDKLYEELQSQHERVNDFVQVRIGELARRLADIEKHVSKLDDCNGDRGFVIPAKRTRKVAKLNAALNRAGADIQSLSRFVGANTLAFKKVLKKYSKWTGSRTLGHRFRSNVLKPATSLPNRNFESLFLHYTAIVEALRDAHGKSLQQPSLEVQNRKLSTSSRRLSSSSSSSSGAAILHQASKGNTSLDLDAALATTVLSDRSARAVYWIHKENLINAQILLLRYASNRPADGYDTPTESGTSSRSSLNQISGDGENYGLVICDDLMRFAKRRSSETVDDIESQLGKAPEKAAASIRFSRSPEAVVAIDCGDGFLAAKMPKKSVRSLWEASGTDTGGKPSKTSQIRQWLSKNPYVKPFINVSSHRTQFVGLQNSAHDGIWATLDRAVTFGTCSQHSLNTDKSLLEFSKDSIAHVQLFPHAILEVRSEGNESAELIKALDQSHLAERIRGFSLETHVVATLCKLHGLPPPYWTSALNKDIRKLPALNSVPDGRGSKPKTPVKEPSTAHTSFSAPSTRNEQSSGGFSAVRGESSMTSAPEATDDFRGLRESPEPKKSKKPRRPKRKQNSKKAPRSDAPSAPQRYWNEFDDGSEGEQDKGYFIEISAEEPTLFPGMTTISTLFSKIVEKVKLSMEKSPFKFRPNLVHDSEREPLASSLNSSPDITDLSDDGSSTIRPSERNYTTFPGQPRRVSDLTREKFLSYGCASTFSASIILLVIATILVTTGRKKAAFEVDIGVIIAVVAAFIFAVMGIGCMMARRINLGWAYRTIVILAALCILVVGLALLVTTSNGG